MIARNQKRSNVKIGSNSLQTKGEPMKRIFHKERKEFLRLWHTYHAKYKIPYGHDEAEDFFLNLTVIFREEKRDEE